MQACNKAPLVLLTSIFVILTSVTFTPIGRGSTPNQPDMIIDGQGNDIYEDPAGVNQTVIKKSGANITVIFRITLQNDGIGTQTFKFHIITDITQSSGWTYTFVNESGVPINDGDTISLNDGEEQNYTLSITSPPNATTGDSKYVEINASSSIPMYTSDAVRGVVEISADVQPDLLIDGHGNDVYESSPSTQIREKISPSNYTHQFWLQVQNDGNFTARYVLTFNSSLPTGWEYDVIDNDTRLSIPNKTVIMLKASQRKNYTLHIYIPDNANAGDIGYVDARVEVEGNNSLIDCVRARARVGRYKPDLAIEDDVSGIVGRFLYSVPQEAETHGCPGDTLRTNVTLYNDGDVDDRYLITVNCTLPPKWHVYVFVCENGAWTNITESAMGAGYITSSMASGASCDLLLISRTYNRSQPSQNGTVIVKAISRTEQSAWDSVTWYPTIYGIDEIIITPNNPINISADIHMALVEARVINRTYQYSLLKDVNGGVKNVSLLFIVEDPGSDNLGDYVILGSTNISDDNGTCYLLLDTGTHAGDDWIVYAVNTSTGLTNSSALIRVVAGALNIIELSPYAQYPKHINVSADSSAVFKAIGYDRYGNINKSWTPTWGTTDNLGQVTPGPFDEQSLAYTAHYYPYGGIGYDNITVQCNGVVNESSIAVVPGRVVNISLKPYSTYPSAIKVCADDSIMFVAVGYDALGNINKSWRPSWNSSENLGTIQDLGFNETLQGFVANYTPKDGLGYDNITVCCDATGAKNMSCIKVIPGEVAMIEAYAEENYLPADGENSTRIHIWLYDVKGNGVCGEGKNISVTIISGGGSVGGLVEVGDGHYVCTYTSPQTPSTNVMNITYANLWTHVSVHSIMVTVSAKKSSDVTMASPNSTITYILEYVCEGNDALRVVWINDTLPPELEYVSDSSGITPNISGRNISWRFENVDVGSHSITLKVRVRGYVTPGTNITNKFSVEYFDRFDREFYTESNTVMVNIIEQGTGGTPPTISGVPDVVVHYDAPYVLDLSPYVYDPDTDKENLTLILSDTLHASVSPSDNLKIVLNYPEYIGDTKAPYTRNLTITVSDGYGSSSQTITIYVLEDYPPQLVAPLSDVVFDEDCIYWAFNLDDYFKDPEGAVLEYYAIGMKNITVHIAENNSVRFSAVKNWYGMERITFVAYDPNPEHYYAKAQCVINVTVRPVNDPPVMLPISDIQCNCGENYTIDLSKYIYDVDNNFSSLSIIVKTKAEWSINGTILVLNYESPMVDEITISVSDGEYVVSETFNVTVGAVGAPKETFSAKRILPMLATIAAVIGAAAVWALYRQRTVIDEVFLVYRDGTLIAHATRRLKPEYDEDIMAGMLTAIQDFVKDSFKDEAEWTLNKLEFGESSILITHGKYSYLAVVYKGRAGERLRKKMDEALSEFEEKYAEVLENWDGVLDRFRGAREIIEKMLR